MLAYGDIARLDPAGTETIDSRTVYRYRAVAERRLMLWRFVFDASGQIAEMVLEEDE